jgi:hypothetical protein
MQHHSEDRALLSSYLATLPDLPGQDQRLLISYHALRKAVGVIGIALPFVLAIGDVVLTSTGLEGSVSGYYYTPMRDVFVGSLCAIAVFLWTYQGYDWRDAIAGNIASVSAVGVALFPTTPEVAPTLLDQVIGGVHLVAAAVFFLTLAYFCLALFKLTDKRHPTQRKLQRNRVYTICGYTILACLVLIVVVWFLPTSAFIKQLAPIFWLEALAIVAFGVSWLTKGEAILKDRAPRTNETA